MPHRPCAKSLPEVSETVTVTEVSTHLAAGGDLDGFRQSLEDPPSRGVSRICERHPFFQEGLREALGVSIC